MLRFSRRNPNKSANQEVYGNFDFNKTPLALPGTKALVYDDPAAHASWAPHATDEYYVDVGPASNHYVASNSTYQPHDDFVSPTHGVCIQPTARLQ